MPLSNDRFHRIERQVQLWNLTDVETMDLAVAREQFAEARAVLNEIIQMAHKDNPVVTLWMRARALVSRR